MFGWERTSVRLSRSRKKAHAEDRQHYRTNSAWERTPGEVNSSPVPNPVFSRLRCKLIAPPAERLSIGVGVAARRADVAPTTTMPTAIQSVSRIATRQPKMQEAR